MAHDGGLDLWGGVECSVVRIGDSFRNQLEDTGHFCRLEDLERIADLGIRTLRYPALWETIAPRHPDENDWAWHDERFGHIRKLGIDAIAGLVHHGSGPRYTNLTDRCFPEMLAIHAERVARRYPWITRFTPINEPLTTARFSGLYGHWYPHGKDDATFLRALLTQCRATVLAMRAIRRVTPEAKLIQTEDIGKTFGTPLLAYQADYENDRRWLSLDLLCGHVTREHPFWKIFLDNGVGEDELRFFQEDDGAPDILGVNYYPTSERFLDDAVGHYPENARGGNGRHNYADVEAVRIDLPLQDIGLQARLSDVWERYKRPMAVTEVQLGCTREEQLRWLKDVWQTAAFLRAEGKDIRAVTVWSLFGAVDWNSLLLAKSGSYEPGAFDVRGSHPRLTAIGRAAAALSQTGALFHPVLQQQGWWRREARFYHKPPARLPDRQQGRPILITGADSMLGLALREVTARRGLHCVFLAHHDLDVANEAEVYAALDRHLPWAVVNAAGGNSECELNSVRASATETEVIAAACRKLGLQLASFSSDRVFDGKLSRPYVENDAVNPLCNFGKRKVQAERRIAGAHPGALLIRVGPFFGPWERKNIFHRVQCDLEKERPVFLDPAERVSPTYMPDLSDAALDLLIDGESGVWHLANDGETSWGELAEWIAAEPECQLRFAPAAGSARNLVLTSEKAVMLPTLSDAIQRYLTGRPKPSSRTRAT